MSAGLAALKLVTRTKPHKSTKPKTAKIVEEFTDVYNARAFAAKFKKKLIFVPQRGHWLDFSGGTWASDDSRGILQHAVGITDDMITEAGQMLITAGREIDRDKKEVMMRKSENLLKHARASQQKSRLEAIISIAATDPSIVVSQARLDTDDMSLGVKNGVVDLRDQSFREADADDLISRGAGCDYAVEEDVACKVWAEFLRQVQPDPGAREWLQRFAGYCLTGRTDEQIFTVFHGVGANGKSVFVETLKRIMGSYATTTQFETFTEKKGDSVRNDLAALDKVRLVIANEGGEGARLDEGIVKQVTGGDEISARFLHREFFTYTPRFKIVLVTNHKPVISGNDNGIWRRVVLVPWPITIPAGQRDKRLLDKLDAERAGILAWCLRGLRDYQKNGLGLPVTIEAACADYRKDSDIVGLWLDDCAELHRAHETSVSDLYRSYQQWTDENGHRTMSAKTLGDRLRERELEPGKSRGVRVWRGLRLLPVV